MDGSQFDVAYRLTWGYEKGFSSNPHDPGGDTKNGVTQGTYDEWRGARSLPLQSVRFITPLEERWIYQSYWTLIRGDELPSGLNLAVFDYAFNSGPKRAIEDLQIVVGIVSDGELSPVTIDVVQEDCQIHTTEEVIKDYCKERLGFLHHLKTWLFFSNGWTRRVDGVCVYSCHVADTELMQAAA